MRGEREKKRVYSGRNIYADISSRSLLFWWWNALKMESFFRFYYAFEGCQWRVDRGWKYRNRFFNIVESFPRLDDMIRWVGRFWFLKLLGRTHYWFMVSLAFIEDFYGRYFIYYMILLQPPRLADKNWQQSTEIVLRSRLWCCWQKFVTVHLYCTTTLWTHQPHHHRRDKETAAVKRFRWQMRIPELPTKLIWEDTG